MKRSHENRSPDKRSPSAESSGSDESGFLGRWSRRKRGAEVLENEVPDSLLAETPEADLSQSLSTSQNESELQAEELDAEDALSEAPLTDADMPDIETLNADSDFSPFFSEGVSKELRNLALKKLFFSGRFSVRDGLDDYDDDFTKFEPLGDTVTSDMKFHARRKEKARLAELEEQRLLQEREEIEAANSEDADEEVAAEDNPAIENSEQQIADSCEPEVVTSDHPEPSSADDSNDENTSAVALEKIEDTVRTPEGKV